MLLASNFKKSEIEVSTGIYINDIFDKNSSFIFFIKVSSISILSSSFSILLIEPSNGARL